MRILSLFDGMACGYLAMLGSNIPIDRYVAFEIDKYAIQTAKHNFPDIEERGDVFNADFTEFADFDYVVGGSPCTYWSIAQTKNRETEASGMGWELFCQYVRALREAKPKFFIYENNKSMSSAIRQSISEAFGFEPICINSALVSAQNRQRLYWVGKRNEDGTYSKVDVKQPEDRGILLRDILEYGICEKDKAYCLKHQAGNARDHFKKHHTNIKFEPVNTTKGGKSQTIKAQYQNTSVANICCYTSTYGASGVAERVPEYGATDKARPVTASYAKKGCSAGSLESEAFPKNKSKQKFDYIAEPINTYNDRQEKSRTLMSGYYKYGTATLITNDGFKGGTTAVSEPVQVGRMPREDGVVTDSKQYRVYDVDGKAVTQCGQGGGLGAKTGLYALPVYECPKDCEIVITDNSIRCVRHNAKRSTVQGSHVNFEDGKSQTLSPTHVARVLCYAIPCEWDDAGTPTKAISASDGKVYTVYKVENGLITIKDKQYQIKLADGYYIIRKLTVREWMRLQTVPEWYEFPVSPTQAYKLLGNGWTVDVIAHLINATKE